MRREIFNSEILYKKELISLEELVKDVLHYKRLSSFYRLKAKGEIPPSFRIGNRVAFKSEDVLKFYLETLPKRKKATAIMPVKNQDLLTPNFLTS